jgi:hypothetical protein
MTVMWKRHCPGENSKMRLRGIIGEAFLAVCLLQARPNTINGEVLEILESSAA